MTIAAGDLQSMGVWGWFVTQGVPAPTLAVEDLEDGSGARYTITDSAAGVQNVCYAIDSTGAVNEIGTIVGNGSEVFALDVGPYWGFARASNAYGSAVSNFVPFGVTDGSGCVVRSDFGDDFEALEEATLLPEFGETITYRRGIAAVSLTGILAPVITRYDPREGIDVAVGDSSWLVRVEDLDFGAGCVEPRKFDRIVTAKGAEYEVVEPGDIDRERIMRSIPTRRSEHKQ